MQSYKSYGHTDNKNTTYSIDLYQNVPFFIKNRPKMAILWSQIRFCDLRQAVQDHPSYFEGAECGTANGMDRQITKKQFTASLYTRMSYFHPK